MDGRKSRYIGEVLERYQGEGAGDLKKNELDELVENWTCLNALGRKIWKINSKILMDEKSWKTWKSNQKIVVESNQSIVTDEDFVKNSVMDEEKENNLMDAKIGPKVVMDLSMFKIGGWNNLQPSNQK